MNHGRSEAPKVHTTKSVRFAALVAAAGKPEVYLPLFDPKQDKEFMRAVKENRVLSIRQEPTSKRTDFGFVGFDEHRHTTLLIFQKPLTRFVNARVIGIKYDVVGESRIAPSTAPKPGTMPKSRVNSRERAPKLPISRAERARAKQRTTIPKPAAKPPKPPPRPEPQPKEFQVQLRITTIVEKTVTVNAMTKGEAKEKAVQGVEGGIVKAVSISQRK